jgi:hypothetical protein
MPKMRVPTEVMTDTTPGEVNPLNVVILVLAGRGASMLLLTGS